MAKFNLQGMVVPSTTIFTSTGYTITSEYPDTYTHEGARAYTRDNKSQLFLTAVTSLMEDSFYESASETAFRLSELVNKVVPVNPRWFIHLVRWLRHDAGLRSVSVYLAVVGAHAMLRCKIPGAHQLIDSVIARADEPGEVLAAWRATYGRKIPSAVKRGINDGINRVWNEYSVLKYNSKSKGKYSFADVMNLTHPKMARYPALGEWIMADNFDRVDSLELIPQMMKVRQEFEAATPEERRRFVLSGQATDAGLTWEYISSTMGKPDAELWEALLPSMGYMAKLRSLRRLEGAGVSEFCLNALALELSNKENVKRSKQMPLRFLSAYRQASLRFSYPLEQALNHSLENIPSLGGRNLILVDRSGSMYWDSISRHSSITRVDTANLFGAALALRAKDAKLVAFSSDSALIPFRKGESVLQVAERKTRVDGGGTSLNYALKNNYCDHDRVIILTDEQSHDSYTQVVPQDIPVYTFNLAGYNRAFAPSGGNRYTFGGLTDQCFKAIEWIENGRDQQYPWEENK